MSNYYIHLGEDGGGGGNAFTIFQTDAGTYPSPESSTDTLSILGGTHVTTTGSSGADSITISTDATNANTVSTIVARDSNGDFAARIITAALIGIVYKATNTISALAIDWSLSNVHTKSIGATNTTFTFSNTQDGQCITVIITSTTGTVTWPTVKWQNGSAPTQTANSTDVYTFVKAGSTFYGSYIPAVS
jgi:hypothetical protein